MPPSPGYIAGPLVIPDTVEVALEWDQPNGKRTHNVVHALNPGPVAIDEALCDTLMEALRIETAVIAYMARISDGVDLGHILMRNLNAPLFPQFESAADPIAGTNTATPLPEEVALVATLKTSVAGRGGRGRTFLSGFGTDQVDGTGHALAGCVADSQSFMRSLKDHLTDIGLTLSVSSRGHNEYVSPITGRTIPGVGPTSFPVLSIVVKDNVFDSQRRRK